MGVDSIIHLRVSINNITKILLYIDNYQNIFQKACSYFLTENK